MYNDPRKLFGRKMILLKTNQFKINIQHFKENHIILIVLHVLNVVNKLVENFLKIHMDMFVQIVQNEINIFL